ncbi:MAG: HAD family hydrolase [Planctomycetes bacterium]|nr:HAD family hydrolase [Planctomycetota bacterium]
MSRPAVFLDRDGTLNAEVDFLTRPEELVLLPGAAAAVRRLNEAARVVVVITNQSGVARGKLDEAQLGRIHARLDELLAAAGARVDAYYYCPHHPTVGPDAYRKDCDCRKPLPGMLVRAAREHDLDLGASWTVGDSLRDVEAGLAAGTRAVLVATGKPDRLARESAACFAAADLGAAVDAILARG